MSDKIVFILKKVWLRNGMHVNLYQEIKTGKKTVEYRKVSEHWKSRLLNDVRFPLRVVGTKGALIDLTDKLKARKAWFMVGFKKNCLPRLEARITKLLLDPRAGVFHVHVDNVVEKKGEVRND